MGTQSSSPMLGRAVSSSTPNDFQPKSHKGLALLPDQPPCHGSTAGHGVRRGGNAEGVGLGNRFAQQINQCVVDADVVDAGET